MKSLRGVGGLAPGWWMLVAGIVVLAASGRAVTVAVVDHGSVASEDGQAGVFTVYRDTGFESALNVAYTLGGSAVNGTDYATLGSAVTIPAGFSSARVIVRPIADAVNETNETVTLTLSAGAGYELTANSSAVVTIAERNTLDTSRRFVRGTGAAPTYQSFVIPLDFQRGVVLDASDGNATNLFLGNPWTNTLYHFDATNTAVQTNLSGRIPFKNPMVAFGSRVGGSPLYVSNSFSFGIHAGYNGAPNPSTLVIRVYNRSNFASLTNMVVSIPQENESGWDAVALGGYTKTVVSHGLTTVIGRLSGPRWGSVYAHSYVLTHQASVTATNYIFQVDGVGSTDAGWMASDAAGNGVASRLYVFEVEERPLWRAGFVDQPHFEGRPLPPTYHGKSQEELLAVWAAITNVTFQNHTNYLQLNHSPELRVHPALNQFVTDLGKDALALANYVMNEVGVNDLLDYDSNRNARASLAVNGLNRSAWAAFQEGQGSPVELCSLLVYLLRQAGVPATYVYPTNEGMQVVDFQLSRLVRVQLKGAMNEHGRTNLPHLVSLNYPWVAAYLTNESRWVHLFPWLKDTEIVEGLPLYEYLPTNYNSGYKWLVKYLEGDTNILALSAASDQPAVLFPKFIEKSLNDAHRGISLDDLGVRFRDRRRLYARWDDFPRPFAVNGPCAVLESFKNQTNLFNTVSVRVYSEANTNKFVESGEMRVADLHNRKFLLRFEQIGATNEHRMILSLGPYHAGITNKGVFGPSADPTYKLSVTNQLASTDDFLRFRVTYKRLRMLGTNYTAAENNLWEYLYDQPGVVRLGQEYVREERSFRKGDLVAFCLDTGRVSEKMLRVHAEELWRFEQVAPSLAATNRDPEVYLGTTAYLMGMSYFENVGRFRALNERLHKVQRVGGFNYGFALLRPKRDGGGQLINGGAVVAVEPGLHMPVFSLANIYSGTLHPDSGRDYESAHWDSRLVEAAHASAAEHGVIRSFFLTNAVSTVSLLRQIGPGGMVRLTAGSYTVYQSQLEAADAGLWLAISNWFNSGGWVTNYAQVFATPDTVTSGSFTGLGAMLIHPFGTAGLISGLLNGALGYRFPDGAFSADNSAQFQLLANPPNADSRLTLLMGESVNQSDQLLASSAAWERQDNYLDLDANELAVDPSTLQAVSQANRLYGAVAGDAANGYQVIYDTGVLDSQVRGFGGVGEHLADPVNVLSGEFYIDAVDLRLPGPMPLDVRRSYASQNLAENQFGYGWKMNYMPYLSVGTNSDLIYAAEADGSVLAFKRQAPPNDNLWLPTAENNPRLHNNTTAGIGSVANLFHARIQSSTSGGTNFYILTGPDGSVRLFEERSYSIGADFDRRRPYLVKWQDARGNGYTFEYGQDSTKPDWGQVRRVQGSNGGFLGFYYDVAGHVVEAYAGDGRRLYYEYNAQGDLVKVTFPDGSEHRYEYQLSSYVTNGVTNAYSTHLLVREEKPDGRVLRNEYDGQRRVTNQWSTVGVDLNLVRNARFVYAHNFDLNTPTNLLTGKTDVYDYTNRLTTYFYTNSLIRKITDPLNQSVIQDWYESDTGSGGYRRSLKFRRDQRGLETTWKYDAGGNATNITVKGDLRGDGDTNATAVTLATFTTNNLPLKTVDARGTTNLFFYTNTWLLARVEIWPSNATAAQAVTNLFTYTTVTNSTNGQVAYGLPKLEIRAAYSAGAATNEWVHDARGYPVQQIRYTGTGDPAVTNHFVYNARGEMVEQRDGVGRKTLFGFDGLGRPTMRETFNETGLALARAYTYFNPNGEAVWEDGPRYDPEDYVFRDFDGAGRQTMELRWRSRAKSDGSGVEAGTGDELFATAFNEYDPFGNLTKATDPRGNYRLLFYDALDRLNREVFYSSGGTALATNRYFYEPGGEVTLSTNALGAVTETKYTQTGQRKFAKNADGSTNAWRYYLDGRLHKEIQRNGAYWESSYNDAARQVTRVFKRADGTPLATNVTELDPRGNAFRQVDAAGFAFTNWFDGLDRLKWSAGPILYPQEGLPYPNGPPPPVQQASTNFYGLAGVVVTNINARGDKTITWTDALGRVVRTYISGANGSHRFWTDYAPNHHSVTVTNGFVGDDDAIVTTTYTDNNGQEVLTVRYPASGVLEYDLWRFDASGNRLEQRLYSKTNTTVVLWQTNAWAYDGFNRVTNHVARDGATTTFTLDALGNALVRTLPGGLQAVGIYTNDGRVLRSYHLGTGGTGTRTNVFSYYPASSPWAGLLESSADGRGVICIHYYDDWLREATNAYGGSAYEHNLTTKRTYDARGLPLTIEESYNSTNVVPGTVLTRAYDPYSQLQGESVQVGGAYLSSAGNSWGPDGRRLALGFGTFTVRYTWRPDGLLASAIGDTGGGVYTYEVSGLLDTRLVGPRVTTVSSRDGVGRPLKLTTWVSYQTRLIETLSWTGDGLLATHTLVHTNTTLPQDTFTDSRSYVYANGSRRLIEERLNLDGFKRWTNTFTFDNGQAGKAGVLTKVGQASGLSPTWSGVADVFSRVASETNTASRHTAWGTVNGQATVTVLLDSKPMPVTVLGTNAQSWHATLDLSPGAHQLQARAAHPSGMFTTNATVSFTNNVASRPVTDIFDGAGNWTQRLWKNANGTTNRTQTYFWDGRGRLWKVVERDSATNGLNWTAGYDALGRLLRTTEITVTNGVTNATFAKVIDHYYDPLVEFLEVGVLENGKVTWKILGPDMDGAYGGQNGTGGFDAIVPGPELFCPLIPDAHGNIHAVYDVRHSTLTWHPSRETAYGALPGHRPVPLGQVGPDPSAKYAWRNRAAASWGGVWMGGNWYDPQSAQMLSFDEVGFAAGRSIGHNAFNGNPLTFWDPDGRLGVSSTPGTSASYSTLLGTINNSSVGRSIWSGGMFFFEPYEWGDGDRVDVVGEIFEDISSRGRNVGRGLALTAGGFVPGVGDAMDVYTLGAPNSSGLDRTLSGVSLSVNAWTGGLLPNYGPIRTGLRRIGEALTGAPGRGAPRPPPGGGGTSPSTPPSTVTPEAPSSAAGSGQNLLTFSPTVEKAGLEHILRRHSFNTGAENVSRFSQGTGHIEIKGLINEASQSGAAWQVQGGRRVLNANMGRVIGTDQAGNAVSGLRVVVDASSGRVITTYPIPAP